MELNTEVSKIRRGKAATEERRHMVATMLKAGTSFRDMARQLTNSNFPSSLGTIHGDVRALIDEWRTERSQSVEAAMLR